MRSLGWVLWFVAVIGVLVIIEAVSVVLLVEERRWPIGRAVVVSTAGTSLVYLAVLSAVS